MHRRCGWSANQGQTARLEVLYDWKSHHEIRLTMLLPRLIDVYH